MNSSTTPTPPPTPDEPTDVLAREVQRLGLDLARVIAENGLLAARIHVLEAGVTHREMTATGSHDERSGRPVALKPHPKGQFVPVVLPPPAVDGRRRPPSPAATRRLAQALKRATA